MTMDSIHDVRELEVMKSQSLAYVLVLCQVAKERFFLLVLLLVRVIKELKRLEKNDDIDVRFEGY